MFALISRPRSISLRVSSPVGSVRLEHRRHLGGQVQLARHRRRERVVPLPTTSRRGGHRLDARRTCACPRRSIEAPNMSPHGGMPTAAPVHTQHVQRHGRVDRRRRRGRQLPPTARRATDRSSHWSTPPAPNSAVHPDRHRREVRQVGLAVADALHDRHLTGVVQALQVGQARGAGRCSSLIASTWLLRVSRCWPAAGSTGRRCTGTTVFRPSLPPYRMIDDEDAVVRADRCAGPRLGDSPPEERVARTCPTAAPPERRPARPPAGTYGESNPIGPIGTVERGRGPTATSAHRLGRDVRIEHRRSP